MDPPDTISAFHFHHIAISPTPHAQPGPFFMTRADRNTAMTWITCTVSAPQAIMSSDRHAMRALRTLRPAPTPHMFQASRADTAASALHIPVVMEARLGNRRRNLLIMFMSRQRKHWIVLRSHLHWRCRRGIRRMVCCPDWSLGIPRHLHKVQAYQYLQ